LQAPRIHDVSFFDSFGRYDALYSANYMRG
jgi:hypothetical protein